LVESLKQVVSAAEDVGVPLAVEAGAGCPINSAERVRDLIEAVGSPALRFNVDPVNLVASWDDVFNTTSLIHRVFDLCGKYVVCAHAKDITYESTLTLRLNECPLGDGQFDQVTYLRRFEECCPRGFVLIEHLTDTQVPAAKQNLDRAAAVAGIRWT
jgi:sugar phosphate isomerase/epimerase